ncbi:MAG: hemolysin family protein [Meiothermus sp.]|uniref:hemolysin family protein n=1 Tax=Meiothermus sp. TaxID=1955249 RepID=UPI0025DA416C|nr:hemolysin family protein [Meiothermus sp.]MCS7057977.1 hemolysin family protein [Meiothermus sp.]MCS7194529.1 hemolysin family protein [Meiothermus sp.]MCX7740489.1 hemolysin family protein [Meiothermus sp.]MDW8091885.1 hemolysin family protein [Meiothermus sp.]MDW8480872.1 hemolysin family protein [Meiothermus sp.]
MESIPGSFGIIALLIFVNAFFVAAEFSLVAIRRSRVEQMAESGSWQGQLLKKAIERLDTYIATTQLGITATNLVLGAFGEPYVTRLIVAGITALFGQSGAELAQGSSLLPSFSFALSVVLITFVTVLFGELIPKGIALQRTEQVAGLAILPLNLFQRLTSPLVWLFSRSGNFFLRLMGLKEAPSHSMVGSAEELKLIVEASSKQGVLDESEGEIISQILDLEETPVRSIMVPRVEMVTIAAESTLREFWQTVREHRYSRVPVYEGTVDNIIGIAYARDLLEFSESMLDSTQVKSICHPAYFVPETMGARELLREMRRRKTHMAIVVDEFKGTAGLVTLEDIIEEIIGEIYDESDEEEAAPIQELGPGIYVMDASIPLEDVSEALGIELPEGEYGTLSGFLMDEFGRIPEAGERLEYEGYLFIVETADPRGIERVRVEKKPAQEAPLPAGESVSSEEN